MAAPSPQVRIDAGTATLDIAGLLVGVGTRYGSGCTSGHGVCGLSRGSPRSIVATASFIVAGFFTVFLVRHLLGQARMSQLMRIATAFATGLIFGLGLILSGMTDPSKVIGFLDLASRWDPSLAFVMGDPTLVAVVAFQFSKGREKSLPGDAIRLPNAECRPA